MTDLESKVPAEFERLANRPWSAVESEVVRAIATGESAWVEGLRPEAFVHLGIAWAEGAGQRVLFITPDAELLVQRQHRLGTRANTTLLAERGPTRLPKGPGTFLCSAEALLGDALIKSFASAPPDVIFVEQAHAASNDAHEARPSFIRIAQLREKFGARLVAGATLSTAHVRTDALDALVGARLRPQVRVLREELTLTSVRVVESSTERSLADWIAPLPRPALVLCSTPAQADATYAELKREQLPCHRYHAGLSARERATELLQFALPGRRAVLVATSSFGPTSGFAGESDGRFPEDFGRGYTRSDLRSIVHLGLPSSLEQYGIELGLLRREVSTELSRDFFPDEPREPESETGAPSQSQLSHALLLYGSDQRLLVKSLLERKRPCPETLDVVVESLKGQARGGFISEKALVDAVGGAERPVRLVLAFLKDASAIEIGMDGGRPAYRAVSLDLLEAVAQGLRQRFRAFETGDQERLDRLFSFLETEGCRVQAFHGAFGELPAFGELHASGEEAAACGLCDHCDPAAAARFAEARADGARFDGSRSFERPARRRRAPVTARSVEREVLGDDEFAAEGDDELLFDDELFAEGA